jgi:hypothetical protein
VPGNEAAASRPIPCASEKGDAAWKRVEKLGKLLIDFRLAGDRDRNSASKFKTERRRAWRHGQRVWSRGVLMNRERKITISYG